MVLIKIIVGVLGVAALMVVALLINKFENKK